MAGPLRGLGVGVLSAGEFQTLTLIMCAGYLAVLVASRALSLRSIAVAILAANVILLLGPPLISQDVFGYLAFARLGVVHGLDPYTHVAFEAPDRPDLPVHRLAVSELPLRTAVHAREATRPRRSGSGAGCGR